MVLYLHSKLGVKGWFRDNSIDGEKRFFKAVKITRVFDLGWVWDTESLSRLDAKYLVELLINP